MTQFSLSEEILATAATVKVAVDSVQWLNTSLMGEGWCCSRVTSVNIVDLPLKFIQHVYNGIIDMA